MSPSSRSPRFASAIILVCFLVASAAGTVPVEASALSCGSLPGPASSQRFGPDGPIIPSTTRVVALEDAGVGIAMAGEHHFTLPARSPAARGLRSGHVLVGAPTSSAPDGYLLRVLSVSRRRGQVEIETAPASLTEAIQQGAIDLRCSLSGLPVREAVEAAGVGLQASGPTIQTAGFEIRLDRVVLADADGDLSTTFDQVVANGRVLLEPSLSLSLRIRDFEVQEFSFISQTRQTSDLQLVASVDLVDYHVRQEIASYTFAPIVVWVGTVPVVFTPVLSVHVGLDGIVTVGITAGVSQDVALTAGAIYAEGAWSPISEVTHAATFNSPTLFATARLVAYSGPQFSLLVYGVAGPYAQTHGYLELLADPFQAPWWQLFAGVRGQVGVRIEVLGRVLASYEATLFDQKWLLAEADGGFPVSPTETPPATVEPIPTEGGLPTPGG